MAAYPAANTDLVFWGTLGNKHLVIYKMKGDGAGVTLKSGLATLDHVWVQSIDDSSLGPDAIRISSLISGVITFATTFTSGKYWWVFCLGS